MRFDQYLQQKLNNAQPPEFQEYPKYIEVDGKQRLVLNADEEAEALGIPASLPEELETSESDEQSGDESAPPAANLLSAPAPQRKGWPKGKPRPKREQPSDPEG